MAREIQALGFDAIVPDGMEQAEAERYIAEVMGKYNSDNIAGWEIRLDGDDVLIRPHVKRDTFERIRRITGYLVGTLDRFNDGKKAEESERVKHMGCGCDA